MPRSRPTTGREPVLVCALKASFMFLADSRARCPSSTGMDFVELAGYGAARPAASAVRLLKDSTPTSSTATSCSSRTSSTRAHAQLPHEVVRPSLPRSLAVVTLLDRPYRRLVDDLPVRYVGFTAPDEFFGYGFDLDERYRNLPDLHIARFS